MFPVHCPLCAVAVVVFGGAEVAVVGFIVVDQRVRARAHTHTHTRTRTRTCTRTLSQYHTHTHIYIYINTELSADLSSSGGILFASKGSDEDENSMALRSHLPTEESRLLGFKRMTSALFMKDAEGKGEAG